MAVFTPLDRTGWVATASSSSSGYSAPAVLDNDNTTYWLSGANVPQSVTLDMGVAKTFNSVQIAPNSLSLTNTPTAATVYGSTDGTNFVQLYSASWTATTSATNTFNAALYSQPISYTYRYVKVTVTASNGSLVQIAELNVGNLTNYAPSDTVAHSTVGQLTKFSFHQTLKTTSSATYTPQQLTLALVASGLKDGHPGATYSETVNVYGGVGPFQFTVSAGALPAGIALANQGSSFQLSGTPTAIGTYTFSVTVSDSLAHSATQSYEIDIVASGGASNFGWVT